MKPFIILLINITLANAAFCQKVDSLTLSMLKLNFAVPDMPAFKSIGTDPSNLLRPSTVQALGVTMSEFYQNRKLLLPEALAIEISPALLINNAKKSPDELREYARKAVLNSLRFSVGTSADSSLSPSGRNLSFGLRLSLINKGDLTTDTDYQDSILNALKGFRENVRNTSLKEFAILKNIDITQLDWEDIIFSDKKLKAAFDVYVADEEEQSQKAFLEEFKRLKENYKKKNWNASKLDLAAAILSSSADSLIRNIRFSRVDIWLTLAQRAGKNGQLLIGLNGQASKEPIGSVIEKASYFNISIPARYLLGTNRVKGFAEAQYTYLDGFNTNRLMLNLGSELNVMDGLWLNVYGGLNYDSKTENSAFITNFNIKLTLPENFKFF